MSVLKRISIACMITVFISLPVFSQTKYREVTVTNGGSIRGNVQLQSDASKIEKMQVTKDNKHCGSDKVSCRLTVRKSNGVANAIISLEGIMEGKKRLIPTKMTLNQVKCEYVPHTMILPLGSQLEIVNSDAVLHNVHAYEYATTKTVFNLAQPVKGQKTIVKQKQLEKPGLFYAVCDAGHPWMYATVMVADHPYYALTDAKGNFELKDVPPGTYKVKMWHEGVNVTKKDMEGGKVKKYNFEEPYEVVQEVTVPANGSATVNFELVLR